VSNYVVLLARLDRMLDQTVAAASTPTNPAQLAQLAQRAGEIRADAEAARRTLSILRTGGPQLRAAQ